MLFVRKYDPSIHHRRSIRLRGYDYSRKGRYFVTLCCQGREQRFGNIEPAGNPERFGKGVIENRKVGFI